MYSNELTDRVTELETKLADAEAEAQHWYELYREEINMKCLSNCEIEKLQLQDKLELAELEVAYLKDQLELSEHKSRQKDILCLDRPRNPLLIPL